MTNTREEVAVAEAILEASDGYMSNPNIAKAAIAASNSQYVAGLVEALKGVKLDYEVALQNSYAAEVIAGDSYPERMQRSISREAAEARLDFINTALNNLPEELRG